MTVHFHAPLVHVQSEREAHSSIEHFFPATEHVAVFASALSRGQSLGPSGARQAHDMPN